MTIRDILTAFILLLITALANSFIWLNGAATNPYAVLILVPMAAAMLLLPFRLAWLVIVVGVAGQLMQLQAPLPTHHQMDTHYRAMVYGQIFAGLLLGVTLHILRVRIVREQQALRALHQRQHRDEQLVTIGTAAAQFSHEVATPIQTIQFMLEDVRQRYPNDEDLQRAEQQIKRIHNLLLDWRQVAEDVRTHRVLELQVNELVQQVRDALLIARPDIRVHWHDDEQPGCVIHADRTLIPAILSLLHNAADAAPLDSKIDVKTQVVESTWQMIIRNEGEPLDAPRKRGLGRELLPSSRGVGAGAMLSYATFERFGGTVSWHAEAGHTLTEICMPVEARHG
ncbi:sensor histidine kinase [Pseudidiomarina andamanensis]|uniref:histidine kinase n=1 Tax=Pseudidiomarina andamanensis TaxID=1940690 RepID=A0AA92IM82_9GAMM|nr:sensor histidine kinase [Pseudidiomarina andamanensis]